MTAVNDLTNQTFTRWRVVSRSGSNSQGRALWNCVCSCGTTRTVLGHNLLRSISTSCGCLKSEVTRSRMTVHGHTKRTPTGRATTKTFSVWASMVQRCANPNNKDWAYYGGRGIKVCRRWLKFENFLADMGEVPPGLTLDRKNNNRGYSKANCRWVTWAVQRANRREKEKR